MLRTRSNTSLTTVRHSAGPLTQQEECLEITSKVILDAACGGRMFWFNKRHPNAIYIDSRVARKGHEPYHPNHAVEPDIVMDFRKLRFKSATFNLVVFDPPHFTGLGPNRWLVRKYGVLNRDTWRSDIRAGFDECWRVLKPRGVLIVKWCRVSDYTSAVSIQRTLLRWWSSILRAIPSRRNIGSMNFTKAAREMENCVVGVVQKFHFGNQHNS